MCRRTALCVSCSSGTLESLRASFMSQGVMCRDTVSVRWDGVLYECDFNQHCNTSFPVKVQDVLRMLQGVMCRDTVSVGWDGALYDCDFNQQLALSLGGAQAPRTVFDISTLAELEVIGCWILGQLTSPPCRVERPQDQ